MKAVDLHVHSTRSDGTYTPAELVEYAIKKDLRAFALTDHDTTTGIAEAVTASANSCVPPRAYCSRAVLSYHPQCTNAPP